MSILLKTTSEELTDMIHVPCRVMTSGTILTFIFIANALAFNYNDDKCNKEIAIFVSFMYLIDVIVVKLNTNMIINNINSFVLNFVPTNDLSIKYNLTFLKSETINNVNNINIDVNVEPTNNI